MHQQQVCFLLCCCSSQCRPPRRKLRRDTQAKHRRIAATRERQLGYLRQILLSIEMSYNSSRLNKHQ